MKSPTGLQEYAGHHRPTSSPYGERKSELFLNWLLASECTDQDLTLFSVSVVRDRRHMRERVFHGEQIGVGEILIKRIQRARSSLVFCLSHFFARDCSSPLPCQLVAASRLYLLNRRQFAICSISEMVDHQSVFGCNLKRSEENFRQAHCEEIAC